MAVKARALGAQIQFVHACRFDNGGDSDVLNIQRTPDVSGVRCPVKDRRCALGERTQTLSAEGGVATCPFISRRTASPFLGQLICTRLARTSRADKLRRPVGHKGDGIR